MKPWNAVSSPVQATPTKSTEPAQRLLAASTEAASRLQMLQVGAQNQNTTGRSVYSLPSKAPPPTSGALKSSTPATAVSPPAPSVETGVDATALSACGSDPEHPASAHTSASTAIVVTAQPRAFTT
jgi:hypothetical protein